MAERALLEGLGGTCHSPIGVHTALSDMGLSNGGLSERGLSNGGLRMVATLFSADGAERVDGAVEVPRGDLDAIRAFAADLLDRATPGIAALFSGAD
ncbi:MAG: hypothetical protein CL808_08340 [Citromicrobium sp.]|nr:hypothetical protein [Citromicrobium sp.]